MIYGLVGEKLAHSYSPFIHSQLADYDYKLYEVEPSKLKDFILKNKIGGLNITIPYKKEVMQYCDELSPAAKAIGSVNTIYTHKNKLYGDNTDIYGFMFMLQKSDISLKNKNVIILGSGGTSLTAQYACRLSDAKNVVVISRSSNINYDSLENYKDYDIIINTTPVGMYPNNLKSVVDLKGFYRLSGVADVIYNPIKTKLIFEAKQLNIKNASGLSMLVAQAAKSCELFTGTKISVKQINRVIKALYHSVLNIVLVGMPGCGKTSIAKALAQKLSRPVLDTDLMVEQKAGMKIPEIFKKYSEAHFRTLEKSAVLEAGKQHSSVIATGGGVVMDADNYLPLRQNSRIYYIDRPVSMLQMSGRPLSKSTPALYEMYNKRKPLYTKYSDKRIINTGSIESAADAIIEDFYENFSY